MISEPIALIGAACRFPGAADLAEFAELLAEGRDAVTEIDPQRWARGLFYHPDRAQPGKTYTCAAGTIPAVDQFDPMFFGISPREAVQMDPQQRLLLELTHEAIEDAGIDGSRLCGAPVGVYIGGSSSDYMTMRLGDPSGADAYFMTGSTLCSLANRISYVFDLRGPSFTVDTACSSSLVALHLACEALRAGEVEAAVVGGVNLLLAPQSYVGFARAGMLSALGRCHAFDARADGYVRAEGGGVVLLKRLSDARAAGDMVRAVICATGVNSDGRTTGFSLPNKAAQIDLLREVYGRCDVAPDDLVYVEAHGTGTPAGDPIEAAAIGSVLGQPRHTPLPVGSVKTNLGHLEPASGMAGLLKVMLALEHGVIPRSLHCETPNPAIPFDALNLRLVPERLKFPRGRRAAAAGVNSFGFGGTNAHAVLTAVTPDPAGLDQAAAPGGAALPPLLLSARADSALRALAASWRQRLAKTPVDRVAPALRGLARGREQHPVRLVVAGENRAELLAGLDAFLADREHAALATGAAVPAGAMPGIVLVFSGNGSQWPGMGAEALRRNPAFAAGIDEVDQALAPLLGWSVRQRLEAAPDEALLRRTEIAQPLLFAIQIGCVHALRGCGLYGTAQLGHSAGEVAAAWAAGALSLQQAARVIAARSHRQQALHGDGRMAVLGVAAERAGELLAGIDGVELAAINAPGSVTIAGSAAGVAAAGERAAAARLVFSPLDLDYAFHSARMDPIEAPLLADLEGLRPEGAGRNFFSTVTGGRLDGHALDAGYWWRNVRAPVRFAEAVGALIDAGARLFLEVGPQPVLQSYLQEAFRSHAVQGRAVATLSRRPAGRDPFALIAARCHVAGHSIAGTAIFDGPALRRGLPVYPWQRERYWVERTIEATDTVQAALDHPLLGFRRTAEPNAWFNHLSTATEAWLADHVVDRAAVLPAAAIIDLALAAARARHPEAACLELRDLEITRPLLLDGVRELAFRVGDGERFELASRPRLDEEAWTVHATGRLGGAASAEARLAPLSLASNPAQAAMAGAPAAERLEPAAFYALAERLGLSYGPQFRTVGHVTLTGTDEALAGLVRPPGERHRSGYLLDPALLDGALQGLVALAARRLTAALNRAAGAPALGVLPWRFGRVRLLRPAGASLHTAGLRITRAGPRSVCAEIALADMSGTIVAELSECWFVIVPIGRPGETAERVFRTRHVPAPEPTAFSDGLPAGLLDTVMAAAPPADPGEPAELQLLADAYATERAYAALADLAGAGEAFTLTELVASGRLAAAAEPMAEALLGWLEADGLAERQLGRWTLAQATDLPEPAELWRSLLFDAPACVAETALLGLAGESLAGRLRHAAPVELPAALLEQMLTASPAGGLAVGALADAVAALAAAWPVSRPLRILQLGAGRGATTRRVLQRLSGPLEVSYVAAAGAADELPALSQVTNGFAGARARLWRPGDNPANLGAPRGFDLVIGCFTLFGLDRSGLAAICEALAPGGLLLAVEPEPNRLWDLIRGVDPHWWHGEAGHAGTRLRPPSAWRAALAASGFVETGWRSLASPGWPVALIGARRDPALLQPAAHPGVADGPIRLFAGFLDELAEGLEVAFLEAGRSTHRLDLAAFAAGDGRGEAPAGHELVVMVAAEPDDPAAWLGRLARDLTGLAAAPPKRLWLVIRAQAAADPLAAALTGLLRVLTNEAPGLDCRLLRIAPDLDEASAIARTAAEILRPGDEREIAWTAQGRLVPRLRRGLTAPATVADAPCRLHIERPGLLDTIGWQAVTDAAPPGAGEVAIAVQAAGLNFRDVMWAIGLLPDEALLHGFAGPTLGLECAGVVRAVGPGVDDLAAGDRVMAFAPACLGTDVVTARHAVVRMPDAMGFAEAATIPVAFLTVAYALGSLAQLAAGERVLIHGAAGGVGLAAIQYARQRGAVVFATAGSPAKRTLLHLLGVEHVLDSRSLAFADEVMALTGGEGVDVVLNSLSGEAMERSLGLLRPFGRFLELGKRDLYGNTAIGLRPLRHNVAYFAIDADQLPRRRPALARALFNEIEALFAAGALRPLPYRRFGFDEASEAFRLMQTAGHIGKIVLVAGPPPKLPAAAAVFAARADRSYVLTGALGGFGLETAKFLVRNGARHLALLGRRGAATPGAAAALAAFAADGVAVRVCPCDVTDAAELSAALAGVRAAMPPIGGIVHAAMVLDDALLGQLDAARFDAVLAPKLAGAELLDRLTRADPVELFLLFSSVTTALGNPGQANYVAANAAIEAIAERRHAEGLPALAVAWGPIGDVGTLARQSEVSLSLQRRLGTAHLRAAEALDALPALLADGHPVLGYAELRWGAARQLLPLLEAPLFSELVDGRTADAAEVDLRALLADRPEDEARALVAGLLVEEVAGILRLSGERIDPLRPLAELGMDSLMAVELRLSLETRFGVSLPLLSLSDGLTLSGMAARVVRALSAAPDAVENQISLVARFEADDDAPALSQPVARTAL